MKKGKVQKVIGLLLAVSMMGSLAACNSGTSTSSTTGASSQGTSNTSKGVTITYLASQDWVRDPEKELGKKFEEKTGIHVDYQIVPADQYNQLLMTKLNSGDVTDIFGYQSGKFDIVSQLNIEKNAADLSNEKWIANFDKDAKEQVSANGKVYGLTIWDTAPIYPVVYNKKIFSDNGLSVPKTYNDFKAACDKILKAGITPIYEPGADGWHQTLWFLDIGPVYEAKTPGLTDNLNNNKATFAGNPTMTTALNQLSEMKTLGFFGKNFLSQTFADTEVKMGSGKFAMTLAGLNEPAAIEKAVPTMKKDNFGYFEIPLADNQILDHSPCAPAKFIFSGSKHQKEAKMYFDFLTEQQNLQYYLDNDPTKVSLCFSGVKDKMNDEMKAFIKSYKETGVYYQNQVKYLNPQWADIDKDLSAMYTGSLKPEDLLKNIDKRRTQQAQTAKDPAWSK